MIQVIKKDFDDINKAISYINETSIAYKDLVDYQILTNNKIEDNAKNDSYIVLLKFDINEEINEFLELAKLELKRNDEGIAYIPDAYHSIVIDEKNTMRSCFIGVDFNTSDGKYMEITTHLGFKAFYNPVCLFNKQYEGIKLKLSGHDTDKYPHGADDKIKIIKSVDLNEVYNHIVSGLLFHGYLFDKESLAMLKDNLKCAINHFEKSCR